MLGKITTELFIRMKAVLERRPVQFLYMNIAILDILCLLLDSSELAR